LELLIGYGTLLYRPSLGHTIGDEAGNSIEMLPVVVEGYQRLFNLRPDHYLPLTSSVLGDGGIENAAMNVEPAPGHSFNGLAFTVDYEQLPDLDRRESYYLRKRVRLRHFDSGEWMGEGWVYSSEPDARWIERDPAALLPLWRDIEWAREGAYRISERFGEYFDETTFLGDGTTLVTERYYGRLDVARGLSEPEPREVTDLA